MFNKIFQRLALIISTSFNANGNGCGCGCSTCDTSCKCSKGSCCGNNGCNCSR